MSEYTYENTRRITYGGDDEGGAAVFIPVCEKCGRFVKAAKTVRVSLCGGLKEEPNAECSRCGPTTMPFEGFF